MVEERNVSPLTRFPPINHDDIRRFKREFNSAGPIDGFLNSTVLILSLSINTDHLAGDIVLEIYNASSRLQVTTCAELWKIRWADQTPSKFYFINHIGHTENLLMLQNEAR